MDELELDGKTYISSKRAAAITGYAKDYVGQLCREGRVEARLIGRSWYVYEPSIRKHRFSEEEAEILPEEQVLEEKESEKTNIQAVWEEPVYTPEEVATIADIEAEDTEAVNPEGGELPEKVEEEPEQSDEAMSEMQEAWRDWFSEDDGVQKEEKVVEEEPEKAEEESYTEPQVHIHKIDSSPVRVMEDIRPIPLVEPKEEGRIVHERIRKVNVYKSPTKGANLVLKAGLIGIIILSVSLAVLGTGITEHLQRTGGTPQILQFLGGTSLIE